MNRKLRPWSNKVPDEIGWLGGLAPERALQNVAHVLAAYRAHAESSPFVASADDVLEALRREPEVSVFVGLLLPSKDTPAINAAYASAPFNPVDARLVPVLQRYAGTVETEYLNVIVSAVMRPGFTREHRDKEAAGAENMLRRALTEAAYDVLPRPQQTRRKKKAPAHECIGC